MRHAEPFGASHQRKHAALSAWWSVGRFGLCVFLIAGALSLLAIPWLKLSWLTTFRRCVSIASVISLWLCMTRFEHRSLRSYGFAASTVWKRQFAFGFLLGFGILGLLLLIGLASGACWMTSTPDPWERWRLFLAFLPAAILIGVLEETAFRGFLLQHLMEHSQSVGIIASSLIYSLVHLRSPERTVATLLEFGGLFLLGSVLCFSYLRTRQLYLSIGLHASLAYAAVVNKLFLEFLDPSSTHFAWLIGTHRLVNGLAGWIGLLGSAAVIAWWTRSSTRTSPRRCGH